MMTTDSRNWKCLIGMHQFDVTIKTGNYREGGEFYTQEYGVFYTKFCCHCGHIRTFYAAEKLRPQ